MTKEINFLNNLSLDQNSKQDKIKDREESVFASFQKSIEDFNKAILFLKDKREALSLNLKNVSDSRLKNFEKIRDLIKSIRHLEGANGKVTCKLQQLTKKEKAIKDEYNILLSGSSQKPAQNDQVVPFHTIYETNKKLIQTTTQMRKDDLSRRRKDFIEVLQSSFDSLEKEMASIEKEKEMLESEKSSLDEKIYTANKNHSSFQRAYKGQIKIMEELKEEIKYICQKENLALLDYMKFLTKLNLTLEIPREVNLRLQPVLLKAGNEGDLINEDTGFETKDLPIKKDNLITFPKAV